VRLRLLTAAGTTYEVTLTRTPRAIGDPIDGGDPHGPRIPEERAGRDAASGKGSGDEGGEGRDEEFPAVGGGGGARVEASVLRSGAPPSDVQGSGGRGRVSGFRCYWKWIARWAACRPCAQSWPRCLCAAQCARAFPAHAFDHVHVPMFVRTTEHRQHGSADASARALVDPHR
jgi:hypothetical protein